MTQYCKESPEGVALRAQAAVHESKRAILVRWFVYAGAWLSVSWLLILAYDGHFGGPFFGVHTPGGRFERTDDAVFFCLFAVTCAACLSVSKWHTRGRLLWFSGLAASAFVWDVYYFSSAFGLCMGVIGIGASGLAGVRRIS
jgi:hypothetical protein